MVRDARFADIGRMDSDRALPAIQVAFGLAARRVMGARTPGPQPSAARNEGRPPPRTSGPCETSTCSTGSSVRPASTVRRRAWPPSGASHESGHRRSSPACVRSIASATLRWCQWHVRTTPAQPPRGASSRSSALQSTRADPPAPTVRAVTVSVRTKRSEGRTGRSPRRCQTAPSGRLDHGRRPSRTNPARAIAQRHDACT
jgi:hypothetical protein